MKYLLLLLLSGCSTLNPTGQSVHRIEWVQLTREQMNKTCGEYSGFGVNSRAIGLGINTKWTSGDGFNGCYRRLPHACVVYTIKASGPNDVQVHRTLGHEVRHCFEGLFHD